MKIILDKNDIIDLIKSSYNGVQEVKLKDELNIEVNVDAKEFKKKVDEPRTTLSSPVNTGPVIQKKPLTEDEKIAIEKKTGVMGTGGRRVLSAQF